MKLKDYSIVAKLYENGYDVFFRGYAGKSSIPVVIKTCKVAYPTPQHIAHLQNEYRLGQLLTLPGIVQAYDLIPYRNGLALAMEDFGGMPLTHYLRGDNHQRPFNLLEVLSIAIKLCDILEALHQQQVIHKDIKPQNIWVNLTTGDVKLTNLGIAKRQSQVNPISTPSDILEGTLAYLSPEQTGRMNRGVDYRTDYYSLGVTLYEALTGHLPFASEDPMEIVHSHIARQPLPPHWFYPGLPEMISAILLKLLAKNAEDRYQSSSGIKADLYCCWHQWHTTGKISEFPLGIHDISTQFALAPQLYGREQEAALLMKAFERVSQGRSELMLIYGASGVGKSALIHHIRRTLVQSRGYFIAGQCDRLHPGIPYHAVIQAFRELIQQLLTERELPLQKWRTQLLEALDNNGQSMGQIMIDVIPALELIIGPQPDVPELSPADAQKRFNDVIQAFVKVFAQPNYPLVLFLDDLHWSDAATLQWIKIVTTDLRSQHLLLIGSYQEHQLSFSHPLAQTLQELQEASALQVNHICVLPWQAKHPGMASLQFAPEKAFSPASSKETAEILTA